MHRKIIEYILAMEIHSYSVTGDILSYLKCGLQYRYYKIGKFPPSKPVQLWFGEFIHAVMNEAYKKYKEERKEGTEDPLKRWSWKEDISDIEKKVYERLKERRLFPPKGFYQPPQEESDQNYQGEKESNYLSILNLPENGSKSKQSKNEPESGQSQNRPKYPASRFSETAIKVWGPHLFPLITDCEVRLQGVREAKIGKETIPYEITGVADVIGSIPGDGKDYEDNEILKRVKKELKDEDLEKLKNRKAEIIVDYKGTYRPEKKEEENYEYQLKTYRWLRERQKREIRVVAGIILYINELAPDKKHVESLKESLKENEHKLKQALQNWLDSKDLTEEEAKSIKEFLMNRSIHIIVFNDEEPGRDIEFFDKVVAEIEKSRSEEKSKGKIYEAWGKRPPIDDNDNNNKQYLVEGEKDNRTCEPCDFIDGCPIFKRKGEQ